MIRIYDPEQGSYRPTYVGLTATGNTVTVRAGNGLMSGTANRASNGLMAGTAKGPMSGTAKVDRDDFLRAVANELDVIVIPRSDLPEVTSTYAGGLRAIHGPTGSEATIRAGDAAADVHSLALCYLAIAEHLENNPPIDEAAVDALTALIRASDEAEGLIGDELDDAYHRTIARHLVKSGVRVPQAGDDQ